MVALALARPAALAGALVPSPLAPGQVPQSLGSVERAGYVEGSIIRAPPREIALGRERESFRERGNFVHSQGLE